MLQSEPDVGMSVHADFETTMYTEELAKDAACTVQSAVFLKNWRCTSYPRWITINDFDEHEYRHNSAVNGISGSGKAYLSC